MGWMEAVGWESKSWLKKSSDGSERWSTWGPRNDSKRNWGSGKEDRSHHKFWQTKRSEESTDRSYCERRCSGEESQTDREQGAHETGESELSMQWDAAWRLVKRHREERRKLLTELYVSGSFTEHKGKIGRSNHCSEVHVDAQKTIDEQKEKNYEVQWKGTEILQNKEAFLRLLASEGQDVRKQSQRARRGEDAERKQGLVERCEDLQK